MKKTVALVTAMILLISIFPLSAFAITPRAPSIYPTLTFNGTTATCGLVVTAEDTDTITATVRLYRGSSVVATWTPRAVGTMGFYDYATVARNATYTLTAQVYINGVAQAPASTTRTNN